MNKNILSKLEKSHYFLILIAFFWFIFQYLYAIPLADYQEHEAGKYFNAANYLLENGHLPNMRYLFYGTITGLIALHVKFKFSVLYIIAFQLLLNLIAILCFGYCIKKRYGAMAATGCVFLLMASYDWTVWNFYLYSESTFFSFTLLWLSSLIYFQEMSFKTYLIQIFLLIGCLFSRPIGVGYILIYGIYLFHTSLFESIKWRRLLLFATVLLFFILSYYISENIEDYTMYKSTLQGCILCGTNSSMGIPSPPIKNTHSVAIWIALLAEHPYFLFKLFVLRIGSLFSFYLPYFSPRHNMINILTTLPVYLAILYRFLILKIKNNALEKGILLFLFVFVVLIGLQCNDWSRRFFSAILPFLILWGVSSVLGRIQNKKDINI